MLSLTLRLVAFLVGLLPVGASSDTSVPHWTKSVLGVSASRTGQFRLSHDFAGVEIIGTAERFGLSGSYRELDALRSGEFVWAADYAARPLAEGLDRYNRWRMDASRRVHSLNSHEAKMRAVTEAYIASRGYTRRGNANVSASIGESTDNGESCELISVTPAGGLTAVFWVGRIDRLVHRIDLPRSDRIETFRYSKYRRVRGVLLPYKIVIDDGDDPATAAIAVSSYRFLPRIDELSFTSPPESISDARIRSGRTTDVSLTVDRATGFPIIFAAIDRHPPMPFILDTGGHDIVTPDAARRLGLAVVGRGESFGAGAGSTPTAFTSVRNVTIGNATMLDQPFIVLDLDLGEMTNTHGQRIPIAGILGLELFERFAISLDFTKGIARLASQLAVPERGSNELPITFTSDVPLVDARLSGRFGSFSVDTGNNVGLIVYRRWLGANATHTLRLLRNGTGGSSVGGEVRFQDAYADSLRLGSVQIRRVPVFIANARAGTMSSTTEAGSIGAPLLSRVSIRFNYQAGTLAISASGKR